MKKKLMITLLTALMAGALFTSGVSAKGEDSKKSLTALGDSITFGFNLEQHNHHVSKDAFPFIIGDFANLRVRDLGVPGWTTQDLLNALETSEKFRQAVAHADYITLNIGSNDLIQQALSDGTITFDEVQIVLANISKIILEARELSDAPVVVYNIYNPFQLGDSRHDLANQLLGPINGAIGTLVQALNLETENIVLADAFAAFGENQAQFVILNDIHPTIEGQRILGEIGFEALFGEE